MGRTDVPNVVSRLILAPGGLHNGSLRAALGGVWSAPPLAFKRSCVRDRHPYGPRPAYNRGTLPSGGAWFCEVSADARGRDCPQNGARRPRAGATPKNLLERWVWSPSACQLCAVEVPLDGFSRPTAAACAQEVKARERGSGQIFDEDVSLAFVEARGTFYLRRRAARSFCKQILTQKAAISFSGSVAVCP